MGSVFLCCKLNILYEYDIDSERAVVIKYYSQSQR